MLISHKDSEITLKNGVISRKDYVKAVSRKFLASWSHFNVLVLIFIVCNEIEEHWYVRTCLGRKRDFTRPQTGYILEHIGRKVDTLLREKFQTGRKLPTPDILPHNRELCWKNQISTEKIVEGQYTLLIRI